MLGVKENTYAIGFFKIFLMSTQFILFGGLKRYLNVVLIEQKFVY